MKQAFRIIAKIGLLFVVFGFFMPIACDQNGFQLADYMMKGNKIFEGLLIYLLLISAVTGVIIGGLLLMKKNVTKSVDWLVIIVCIASGLIVYLTMLNDGPKLQHGAYVILTGWIIAFVAQIIS